MVDGSVSYLYHVITAARSSSSSLPPSSPCNPASSPSSPLPSSIAVSSSPGSCSPSASGAASLSLSSSESCSSGSDSSCSCRSSASSPVMSSSESAVPADLEDLFEALSPVGIIILGISLACSPISNTEISSACACVSGFSGYRRTISAAGSNKLPPIPAHSKKQMHICSILLYSNEFAFMKKVLLFFCYHSFF